MIIGIVLFIARGMKREALQDSVARQEQNENLTEAVLDFVEGIGIIKTYNLLGEKSRELTDNFQRSCDTNLQFEEDHSPWQLRLNLAYGLGAAAIAAIALALESAGLMSVPYLVGIMLFVFDLFGPIKALYTQATRLTVMNSCMDRIEEVFHEPELPDDGRDSIPETGEAPEVEFQHVRFAYGEKEVLHDISFSLPRHQMLALVGPSGGGKSTIANLLTRFWDVKGGRVLVRGKDVREVKLADLMDHKGGYGMPQTEPTSQLKEAVNQPIRHAPCTKLRDILQLKTVAELRSLAGLHGVRRIYQMRKDGLVTAVFDAMLAQDRMESILFLLGSASWRRLLKIAECGSGESHSSSVNNDTILLELCYLQAFLQNGVVSYVMPDEVRSAVLDLIEGGFQARKERSDPVHAYAMAAINLYGVIAKDDLLKIFNMQNRPALTEEELDLVLLRQIAWECGYVLLGPEIASEAFSYNQYRDIPDLLTRVGNKPRYIPTKAEFLRYADPDCYEPTAQGCGPITGTRRRSLPEGPRWLGAQITKTRRSAAMTPAPVEAARSTSGAVAGKRVPLRTRNAIQRGAVLTGTAPRCCSLYARNRKVCGANL